MADVRRRDILRGAIIGPIILSAGKFGQRMPDLDDLDGRTVRKVIDPNNMTALEREHFIKADFPSEVKPWQPFKMTARIAPSASLASTAWGARISTPMTPRSSSTSP